MSRRPSNFVTCGVFAIYIGLPTLLVCFGGSVLIWLYGFH